MEAFISCMRQAHDRRQPGTANAASCGSAAWCNADVSKDIKNIMGGSSNSDMPECLSIQGVFQRRLGPWRQYLSVRVGLRGDERMNCCSMCGEALETKPNCPQDCCFRKFSYEGEHPFIDKRFDVVLL